MRVIITGGSGLIGSGLAQRLAEAGHEVISLSRNPEKYTFAAGIQGVRWDAKTADGWGHFADGADAIVNLAGESIGGSGFPPPRWTEDRKRRIRDSRVQAGEAVMAAVAAAGEKPAVVIQSSGVDYYGNVPGDDDVTEQAPRGSGFLSDVTEVWEASTAGVQEMGVRQVVLRTGIVLSLNSGALPQTALPFRFFAGGPLGDGRQWWPWIHVDDTVGAIHHLLDEATASGAYNVCAPNPLQQKDFAKVLGEVMGRPSFVPAPAFALKAALGEMAAIVLEGRKAVPQRLQASGFEFHYPQAHEALLDVFNR